MNKPKTKKQHARPIRPINFGTQERLQSAVKRSEKLYGPRNLSLLVRVLLDGDDKKSSL